jgi:glycosyltransferase involved in cell wall biosynthesis
VTIAAYQAAAYIGDAVESALGQTVPPCEVIVCDDGSTDDLAGALKRFGDAVTLLRREHAGEGAAKRAAAEAASGDFVVLLDADDVFLPRRLEELGEFAAERPDLDLLTTDAWVEVEGERIGRSYDDPSVFPIHDQLQRAIEANFVFGLAAVRRERLVSVGGFAASIPEVADWHCWIRILLTGAGAGLVYEPLAIYRVRKDSLSANRARHLRSRVSMLEQLVGDAEFTVADKERLLASIEFHRGRAEFEELRAAVASGAPGVRRAALRVARAGHPLPVRIKAVGTAVSPSLARRAILRRRDVGTAITPA